MPKRKSKQSDPRITEAELDRELAKILTEDGPPGDERQHARWSRARTPDVLNDTLRAGCLAAIARGVTAYRISVESGMDASSLRLWLRGEKQRIRSNTASCLMEYLGLELRPKGERP